MGTVIKFITKEGANAKEVNRRMTGVVIVVQSIPQWQRGQQNINVG